MENVGIKNGKKIMSTNLVCVTNCRHTKANRIKNRWLWYNHLFLKYYFLSLECSNCGRYRLNDFSVLGTFLLWFTLRFKITRDHSVVVVIIFLLLFLPQGQRTEWKWPTTSSANQNGWSFSCHWKMQTKCNSAELTTASFLI